MPEDSDGIIFGTGEVRIAGGRPSPIVGESRRDAESAAPVDSGMPRAWEREGEWEWEWEWEDT